MVGSLPSPMSRCDEGVVGPVEGEREDASSAEHLEVELLELRARVAEAGVHLAQVPLAVAAAQLWVAREPDDRRRDRVDVVPARRARRPRPAGSTRPSTARGPTTSGTPLAIVSSSEAGEESTSASETAKSADAVTAGSSAAGTSCTAMYGSIPSSLASRSNSSRVQPPPALEKSRSSGTSCRAFANAFRTTSRFE